MPVTSTTLALLVTVADGSHQLFVGTDECAYRHAFSQFVQAWGEDAVWYDDEAKQLGSDGGVTLSRWRARVLGEGQRLGLIVMASGTPVGIYIVDSSAMAERAVGVLDRDDVTFDLVPVEPLPVADPVLDAVPLTGTVRTRHGSKRPKAPQPRLSDEFCPRCLDHQLCAEPLFDSTDDDGRRVCQACGRLGSMLESAGPGGQPQ